MKRTKDQQFTEYVNSSSLASQHPRVSILHTQSGTSQVAGQVLGFQVIQGMAVCMGICFISSGSNARKWPAFVMDVYSDTNQTIISVNCNFIQRGKLTMNMVYEDMWLLIDIMIEINK